MTIDPNEIFSRLDDERKSGELSKKVTTAKLVYQASCRKGVIEQIDTMTGERTLGTFCNGKFVPLDSDDS